MNAEQDLRTAQDEFRAAVDKMTSAFYELGTAQAKLMTDRIERQTAAVETVRSANAQALHPSQDLVKIPYPDDLVSINDFDRGAKEMKAQILNALQDRGVTPGIRNAISNIFLTWDR